MQFNFVVSSNERAVRLWQSFGFEVVGRLPLAFDHPARGYVDALVMCSSYQTGIAGAWLRRAEWDAAEPVGCEVF